MRFCIILSLRCRIWFTDGFDSSRDRKKLVDVKETEKQTTLCLAAAHALVRLDDGIIVGDPMEKTTLEALDCLKVCWSYTNRV